MDTFTQLRNETFHVVTCYTCGTPFGINDGLYNSAVKDKNQSVYCPSCGNRTRWTGETEDQKRIKQLKRKLEWEANQSARLKQEKESAENSLRSTKGVITKLKKRVHNGVCPCCTRSFKNLERHMKNKHPDYTEA